MSLSTPTAPLPAPPPPEPILAPPGAGLAGRRDVRTGTAQGDAAIFTIGTYVAQFLLFAANLVQRALLGPLLAGYWALMQTFWTYFQIATLGTQQGATRQIPVHRGRNDYAAASEVADTGASFAIATVAVAGSLVAVVALVFGGGWADEIRYGLVLLGLTAPLRYFIDSQDGIIASVKRFDVSSIGVIVKAVAALTLQTLAVWWLGFYGLFVGLVAIELCVLALWLRMGIITVRRATFRWSLDRTRLRELIAFGLPILAYGQTWQLFLSVDALIVAGAINVTSLGYYALALSVTHYVLILPKSIGATLFPRMAERFAQTGEMASIRHYATDTQRLLAYVLVPISIALAYCFVPVLVRQALPAFEPAVPVIHIVVGATFFLALMNMPVKLLITAGYRWSLTGIFALCLLINAAMTWTAVVPLDLGLEGAAGATAGSYLVTFLLTGAFSFSRSLDARQVVLHLGEIVIVAAYVLGALTGIEALLGAGDGLVEDVALGVAKLGLFMLCLTPWLVVAQRRLGALTMLSGLATGALRRLRARK